MRFSGTAKDPGGNPLTGVVGVTFSLYSDQSGGSPLWLETQNVQPDNNGHYSVLLGSTKSEGLPAAWFASEQVHWVGVAISGQSEGPRVLLVSVPYALKAGDADTLGGLPPSAFMLAAPSASQSGKTGEINTIVAGAAVISGSGTAGFLPQWTASTMLGNSALFQTGSGNAGMIGIDTSTPSANLDVNGSLIARGMLQLPSTGTANASQGFSSQPFSLQGSAFNSSSGQAIGPLFQWQTEPAGNNSPTPSGTLNLLYGTGSGSPVETGLNIASNGLLTFASGQTFPGTGNGTITGVTAGTDLTGGGTSGSVTLDLDTTKVPQLGSNNSFTGTAQFAGNTGIGMAPSGTSYTPLSVGSSNSFGTWFAIANSSSGGHTWNIISAGGANAEGAGNLGITDLTGKSTIWLEGNTNTTNLTASGIVSGNTVNAQAVNGVTVNATGSFTLEGSAFAFGTLTLENASLGFAGNTNANNTGEFNTAIGVQALLSNSSGGGNTATGAQSLFSNTTGVENTAGSEEALYSNTTGDYNTAVGGAALRSNTTGSTNTADGFEALYFNTTGGNNTAIGFEAMSNNSTANFSTALGYGAGDATDSKALNGSSNTFVGAFANAGGANEGTISNATAIGGNAQVTESNAVVLGSVKGTNGASANVLVGIGTTAPSQTLEVDSGNSLVRGANNFQKNGDTASLFVGDTNNFIQSTFGTGITIGVYQLPNAVRINQSTGFVGIGTVSPDNLLSVNGTADKPGGGSWGTFSDARLKTLHGTFDAGLSQLLKLHPIRYRYKDDNAMGIRDRDEHVGFVAQDVQRVIPEAVTENNKGYLLVNNDPILWTMLNAIKEQQREIVALRVQLRMRAASTEKPAGSKAVFDRAGARDQELLTVRQQLNQLRKTNGRLEARLARLERTLDLLNSTNTLALASATATQEEK